MPEKERKALKSRWSHKAAAIGIEMAKNNFKNGNEILGIEFESRFSFLCTKFTPTSNVIDLIELKSIAQREILIKVVFPLEVSEGST